MTIQERVQELFDKFNVNLSVTEGQKENFAEAPLDNGTVIYTDDAEFTEGSEVYIINDEGERIALPPGDYTFKDGGKISVGNGGKVASIQKGGDGKGEGDGKNVVDSQPAKTKDKPANSGDNGGGSGSKGVPENSKGGKGKGGGNSPSKGKGKLEDEDENPNEMNYVSREEVEEMIASAIQKLKEEEEKEMEHTPDHKEDEDKTEMSVNPEASSEESAPVEEEVLDPEPKAEDEKDEEAEEVNLSKVLTELEETKAKLFELQKQAASEGLKRVTPTAKAKEPLNLKNLSTAERIEALAKHFNA